MANGEFQKGGTELEVHDGKQAAKFAEGWA